MPQANFITILLSFSCGSLTALAMWGKPPLGGDEFAMQRSLTVIGCMVIGHIAYCTFEKLTSGPDSESPSA